MALADYFARNAVAASQVLKGFDEQRIRTALKNVRVGIAIGAEATERTEGQALLDLLTRLLARLYPTLVVRNDSRVESLKQEVCALARRINPNVEFASDPSIEIVLGTPPSSTQCPQIFAGSNGWKAFISTSQARPLGRSENPFGAGVSACLAAANAFRWVFQGEDASLDTDTTFSALDAESAADGNGVSGGKLGKVVLVGAGAIGNGAAWALSRLPMEGVLYLVDHQTIDLGNLQRYVLAERTDEGKLKVNVLARHFNGPIRTEPYSEEFASFVASQGYAWPRMLLALDTAHDRRAAQASLPEWIANAWTQPGDLGVSNHDFLSGACVSCLYLPQHPLENEDMVIASALGVPERLMQIRTLLHTGEGIPRDLLDGIAAARGISIDRLLPFEGNPLRKLYVEGFCGGAVIPLGEIGSPRHEVHVPLAHQSTLAGLLLAAAAVRGAIGLNYPGTQVTRIDIMRALGSHLTQIAAKDPRGICICQDSDYKTVYKQKYSPGTTAERNRVAPKLTDQELVS